MKDLPNGYQQANILNVINSFSSQNRQDVIQVLKNKSIDQLTTLSFPRLIREIISEDSSLRESLYQHFVEQLQSTHIHVLRQFARLIFGYQTHLLLYEEHPLVQEALHKLLLTENSQDPKILKSPRVVL